jgi:hypothetical protein
MGEETGEQCRPVGGSEALLPPERLLQAVFIDTGCGVSVSELSFFEAFLLHLSA